jgi:hypothetical protein
VILNSKAEARFSSSEENVSFRDYLDDYSARHRLQNSVRMKVSWSPPLVLLFLNIGVMCSIGQGIQIESAYYGVPNRTGANVTRRVQRFADFGEPFRVGNDTLGIDPAPNHAKVLVVNYELNGQQISDSVREGEVFYFRNGAEGHRPAIRIIRALYGTRGRYVDVTPRVRQMARDHWSFTVSNQTFGVDPYEGQPKRLRITYQRGTKRYDEQYEEGAQILLR